MIRIKQWQIITALASIGAVSAFATSALGTQSSASVSRTIETKPNTDVPPSIKANSWAEKISRAPIDATSQVDIFSRPLMPTIQNDVVAPAGPPPFPFSFMGKLTPQGGQTLVFLTRGEDVLTAAPGKLLDGQYRVVAIRATGLDLTYLPLKQKLKVEFSSMPVQSVAPSSGVAYNPPEMPQAAMPSPAIDTPIQQTQDASNPSFSAQSSSSSTAPPAAPLSLATTPTTGFGESMLPSNATGSSVSGGGAGGMPILPPSNASMPIMPAGSTMPLTN